MMSILFLSSLLFLSFAIRQDSIAETIGNDKPMIGILTKPLKEEYDIKSTHEEVLEARYVHFVEAGGGRVVPISYRWTTDQMRALMQKLNGILFPGGSTELRLYNNSKPIKLSPYAEAGLRIMQLAKEFNDNGDYFPVWGTCLGLELIILTECQDVTILTPCLNCSNYNTNIYVTLDGINSSLLKSLSGRNLDLLISKNLSFNYHTWQVAPEDFANSPSLVANFKLVATSHWHNDSSKSFVSIIEGKKYPFYGIQFHPEKWNYEFNPHLKIIKTPDTITLGHCFSNFFVEECKKSAHHFSSYQEEMKYMIERAPTYYHVEQGYLYLLLSRVL